MIERVYQEAGFTGLEKQIFSVQFPHGKTSNCFWFHEKFRLKRILVQLLAKKMFTVKDI